MAIGKLTDLSLITVQNGNQLTDTLWPIKRKGHLINKHIHDLNRRTKTMCHVQRFVFVNQLGSDRHRDLIIGEPLPILLM